MFKRFYSLICLILDHVLFQIEEKCSVLARENNELKSHMEEDEEEMKSLLQKNKTLVAQVTSTVFI